jgi:UDPglucose 6-dehydrogenase
MKIAIIGTGYVGLPSGIGFASFGNSVVCIDKDETKIEMLKKGQPTIYEDGLEELFLKTVQSGNLHFTSSIKEGVCNADIVILAVGTPPHPETKEADLRYIYAAAEELAGHITGYTLIANKSTVPVGTGDEVENIIKKINPHADFDVVSLPEFLREGYALRDFFEPDRIVAGCNTLRAQKVLQKLYEPFESKTQMLFVKRKSAETIKYASNAFLAMKIHYINEIADFCEKSGADVTEVACGMGLDKRIGNKFLNAGVGFGGSCFPKDTLAMALMGDKYGVDLSLIKQTIKGNAQRKEKMADRILNMLQDVQNPFVGVLGLAFKNGTDDVRESPAIEIIFHLLAKGVKIRAFDYQAVANARKVFDDKIEYALKPEDVFVDVDAVAVLTEWPQFQKIDFEQCALLMKHKKIADLRNLLDAAEMKNLGFEYLKVG